MGRKKRCMPFSDAREIVRTERIESVSQYKKWYDLNKPVSLPRRPDRAYHEDFVSWNDFLGNNNPFPIIKHTWRPYTEAKAFAQSLRIAKKQEWLDFCDTDEKPKDIPRRPDLYYRNRNEWVSWGNFLGATIASKEQTIEELNTIFFIIVNPNAAHQYFRCGITNGGISSINDFLVKVNGRLVCGYYVPQTFNPTTFLESFDVYEDYEHKTYFKIENLAPIVSKLSIGYNRIN